MKNAPEESTQDNAAPEEEEAEAEEGLEWEEAADDRFNYGYGGEDEQEGLSDYALFSEESEQRDASLR